MGAIQDLKRGAATYRELLGAPGLATPEEINACFPGGTDNPEKGLKGWARCYGLLVGLSRFAVYRKGTTKSNETAAKRAAVLDAIGEVPEMVPLVQRGKDGEQRSLTVYQKSDLACRLIHEANILLAYLVDDFNRRPPGTADDLEIISRSLREQSYQQRLIVWIATTEGPGIPFPESERRPELPADLANLHALDFYSLAAAFQRVNVAGFSLLENSTAPRTRPDWSVFFTAMEFETGTPVPRLMRDRGLLSLVATASEHARGREEAEKRAKQERKAG